MVTLHAYILRELLKTFGLTLLALTTLFTMGGGLFNVISYEGIGAGDLIRFVPLLIPIVMTLTMPMAALFAATMVYGRLAADNELIACRAAGINVHRTFLSVILLSIFVAAFTLFFGNFVIPGLVGQLESFARNNIRDLVEQSLQHKGFIHRKVGDEQWTLTAERVRGYADQALQAKGFPTDEGLHYLQFTSPTIMQVDGNGDLVRFAVARYGMCIFDVRTTPIRLTLLIAEGRDFEIGKRAVYIDQQRIGPYELSLPVQRRLSLAGMNDLLHWRTHPWEGPKVAEEARNFMQALTRQRFFDYCHEELAHDGRLVLHDRFGHAYELRCDSVQPGRAGLVLSEVHVVAEQPRGRPPIRYRAPRAEIIAAPFASELLVEIRLVRTAEGDVLEFNPRTGDPNRPRPKPSLSLDGALIPQTVLDDVEQINPVRIFDPNSGLTFQGELADGRIRLQRAASELARRINAQIHFRLGYALSTLVTVLMGAALGLVFRGARALAAFALAMIPFFSVMILMVLGRQLTEDAQATLYGPPVTWGGLALVLLADLVILRFGVRR